MCSATSKPIFWGSTPGNSAVTTNSNSLRLRLFWVRLSKPKFEILAGQSWSMLTPNRRGISPLPGDLISDSRHRPKHSGRHDLGPESAVSIRVSSK